MAPIALARPLVPIAQVGPLVPIARGRPSVPIALVALLALGALRQVVLLVRSWPALRFLVEPSGPVLGERTSAAHFSAAHFSAALGEAGCDVSAWQADFLVVRLGLELDV